MQPASTGKHLHRFRDVIPYDIVVSNINLDFNLGR